MNQNQQVVYLNEPRQHVFTTDFVKDAPGSEHKTLTLNPGRNIVDAKAVDEMLHGDPKSDSFCDMVARDVIVIHGEKVDITKVSVEKATSLIELEATIEGVQELLDQELAGKGRKNVVKAAEAKITAIQDALEDAKNKDKEGKGGGADDA